MRTYAHAKTDGDDGLVLFELAEHTPNPSYYYYKFYDWLPSGADNTWVPISYDELLTDWKATQHQYRYAGGGSTVEITNDAGQWEPSVYLVSEPAVQVPLSVAQASGEAYKTTPGLDTSGNIFIDTISDPVFMALTAGAGALIGAGAGLIAQQAADQLAADILAAQLAEDAARGALMLDNMGLTYAEFLASTAQPIISTAMPIDYVMPQADALPPVDYAPPIDYAMPPAPPPAPSTPNPLPSSPSWAPTLPSLTQASSLIKSAMPLIPIVKALTSDGPNKPTLPTSAGSGLIIDTGAPKPLSPGLNIGGTIIPWGLVLAGVGLLITAKG